MSFPGGWFYLFLRLTSVFIVWGVFLVEIIRTNECGIGKSGTDFVNDTQQGIYIHPNVE